MLNVIVYLLSYLVIVVRRFHDIRSRERVRLDTDNFFFYYCIFMLKIIKFQRCSHESVRILLFHLFKN